MRTAIGVVLFLASAAVAAAPGRVGTRPEDRRPTYIAQVRGDVKIRALGEEDFRAAQVGQQLLEGSSVWTEPGAKARVHVGGLAIMDLAPGTLITFVRSKENYPILCRVHVDSGTVWSTVQPGQPFTVEAANASGRARGTQFRTTVDASANDSEWEMLEGRLDLYRLPSNHLERLSAGQKMTIGASGSPVGATPIQLASITEARGTFSRTIGGAPPVSSSVGSQTTPMGTQVVFMTRPPGNGPPTVTVGAGGIGTVHVRPPTMTVLQPAVPIKGPVLTAPIRTIPIGTAVDTRISTPIRTVDPVRVQPIKLDNDFGGGLISVRGRNDISQNIKTGPSFNQGIGVRDIGRRDFNRGGGFQKSPMMDSRLGNSMGGARFGGRGR